MKGYLAGAGKLLSITQQLLHCHAERCAAWHEPVPSAIRALSNKMDNWECHRLPKDEGDAASKAPLIGLQLQHLWGLFFAQSSCRFVQVGVFPVTCKGTSLSLAGRECKDKMEIHQHLNSICPRCGDQGAQHCQSK